MKILVIDDSQSNSAAAQAQLKNHEVEVAGTYDMGQSLVVKAHDFEAVLVDLLMPASSQQCGSSPLVGTEMPVGIFLALLAAKNGARYVAVFTDSDHHSHPASACFDAFNDHETRPTPFTVGEAQVWLSNTRNWVRYYHPEELDKPLEYGSYDYHDSSLVRTKNWRALLDYILGNDEKDLRRRLWPSG